MRSLLLMTVLIAGLLVPAMASRDPSPRRGLKRMLLALLAFNLLYVGYFSYLHPVLFLPQWRP